MVNGNVRKSSRIDYVKKRLLESWQWYLLLLPGLAYLIIFNYIPMGGVLISFQNYRPNLGISEANLSDLKTFSAFLNSRTCSS